MPQRMPQRVGQHAPPAASAWTPDSGSALSKRAAVLRNGMTGKRVSAAGQGQCQGARAEEYAEGVHGFLRRRVARHVPCAACAVSSWLPNGPSRCSTTALKTATPIAPPTARKRCARRWRCRYRPPAPSSAMPPSWAAGSRRCPRPAGRKGQRRQPGKRARRHRKHQERGRRHGQAHQRRQLVPAGETHVLPRQVRPNTTPNSGAVSSTPAWPTVLARHNCK